MTELDVWLEAFGQPVGRIVSADADDLSFTYNESYLGVADAHPISLSLPLGDRTYRNGVARAFFQNLLPENNQLDQLLARERLERGDVAAILHHLGADLSGALSCLPAGSAPVKAPGQLAEDYIPLDDHQLHDIAARLGSNRPLPGEIRDPSPVSGFQRKIALTQLPDGTFGVPRPGTGVPTTHILKVPELAFPREAFFEATCGSLAHHIGLDTARSRSYWIGDYEVILSERFDRVISDGAVYRIHQEDFAQAAGLPPRLKYERNGRPDHRYDVETILRVLRQTASPALSSDAFLRATIFNLAIGNTDNHAKNHALLFDRGTSPRLAPLYDLVPITLSDEHNHSLSFSIGDAAHPDQVNAGDISELLTRFGLVGPAARRFIEQRLEPIVAPLAEAREVDGEWAARFDTALRAQSNRLLDLLRAAARKS
ncbi:HipA domain-containing protein [Sphingopyxis sp.]|uniref:HipA domain-containing protein n=1 Tax=Sphingopyxis sp. TaxID=1908224 RepID=UPI002FCA3403